MARPKRDNTEKQAFERIEEAFWLLLSQMPYEKITIAALSKAAMVNHNLIYYYFENMNDLAMQLFKRNGNCSQQLIALLLKGNIELPSLFADEALINRVQRFRLFMRSDSAFLNQIVKEYMKAEWLKAVNVTEEQLSPENKIDLEFIFSGIISVVGSTQFDTNLEALATLHQRPLGKAMIETLKGFQPET